MSRVEDIFNKIGTCFEYQQQQPPPQKKKTKNKKNKQTKKKQQKKKTKKKTKKPLHHINAKGWYLYHLVTTTRVLFLGLHLQLNFPYNEMVVIYHVIKWHARGLSWYRQWVNRKLFS